MNAVPGRDKPDWASKLHLACAPVYYQNYLIGEMTASQIQHCLYKTLKSENENFYQSSTTGNFLKERLFNLGASFDWNETIRLVTGENLNPSYFVQDIRNCS